MIFYTPIRFLAFSIGLLGLSACGDDTAPTALQISSNEATLSSSGTLSATTPYLLKTPVPSNEPFAHSLQGGDVYAFSDGAFAYEWGLNQNQSDATQRQAYGLQFGSGNAPTTANDFFGLTFKMPSNNAISIADASTLIIQLGNGSPLTGSNAVESSKTHHVFTIALNGGSQDSTTFAWSHVCEYDLTLADDTRPGSTSAAANPYGINTYRIPLSSINTCNFNSTDTAARTILETQLSEVAVKIVGGKDSIASNSTGTSTLLQVGWMGFEGDASSTANTNNFYKTYASGYQGISGATQEPFDQSKEGGDLRGFAGGAFTFNWKLGEAGDDGYAQRNAYGIQYDTAGSSTITDYFGFSISPPNNGTMNIAAASTLLIQIGNGSPLDGDDAVSTSHMTFTLELGSGIQNAGDGFKWTNHCEYQFELDAATRPAPVATPAGVNAFGLHTYAIPLSNFTPTYSDTDCIRGTLAGAKAALKSVTIKVVGGADVSASASASSTLLQIGWIAFE